MHNENRVRTHAHANNNIASTAERARGARIAERERASLPPTGLEGKAPLGKHKLQDFPLFANIIISLSTLFIQS